MEGAESAVPDRGTANRGINPIWLVSQRDFNTGSGVRSHDQRILYADS